MISLSKNVKHTDLFKRKAVPPTQRGMAIGGNVIYPVPGHTTSLVSFSFIHFPIPNGTTLAACSRTQKHSFLCPPPPRINAKY